MAPSRSCTASSTSASRPTRLSSPAMRRYAVMRLTMGSLIGDSLAPALGLDGKDLDRALVVSVAALMATLPFSHTAALIRLLLAIAIVTALAGALRSGLSWRALVPPFAAAWLAWLAWAALSLAWSIDPDYTASELRAEFFYGAMTI